MIARWFDGTCNWHKNLFDVHVCTCGTGEAIGVLAKMMPGRGTRWATKIVTNHGDGGHHGGHPQLTTRATIGSRWLGLEVTIWEADQDLIWHDGQMEVDHMHSNNRVAYH